MNGDMIRTEDVPQCPLCDDENHRILYTGLKDRLFDAPGEWTFKECSRCGLMFLDPRPTPVHLKKAYANYHTQLVPDPLNAHGGKKGSLLRRIYRGMKDGYLHRRWGCRSDLPRWQVFLAPLVYLWPTLRADLDFSVMYLEVTPGGRLLDVGCGSGELLERLNGWGWQGEGLDFDELAVRMARKRGLKVRHGTLETQEYPDESFDAIVMSHVIEHVPEPLLFLQGCYRIIKPNGRLVLVTPNKESWTHKVFKQNWRGLEPPRHLCVFAPRTLSTYAQKAGFRERKLTTTVRDAHVFLLGTLDIERVRGHTFWSDQPRRLRILARLYQALSWLRIRLDQSTGDEIVLIAEKHRGAEI